MIEPYSVNVSSVQDHAWAAGLFDGEGCVYLGRQKHGGVLYCLTVEMNHAPTVWKFKRIVGGRTYQTLRGTTVWRAVGSLAVRAADIIYPYSTTKKADMRRLFKMAALVDSRPRGVPTPYRLRQQYDRLIKENRK